MTDVTDGGTPAEAIRAAAVVIHRSRCAANCQHKPDRASTAVAMVALEAAAPFIAARGAAEGEGYEPFIAAEGWREDTSIRYVPESAVAGAAAAQREADIKLARDYRVMVCLRRNDDGTVYYLHRKDFYPFADVLAAAPEETP